MRNYQQCIASHDYHAAAKQLFDFFNTRTDLTSAEACRVLNYLNYELDAEWLTALYTAKDSILPIGKKLLPKLAHEKKWAVILALKNSLSKLTGPELNNALENVFAMGVAALYNNSRLPRNEDTESAQITLRSMCSELMSLPAFHFQIPPFSFNDSISDKYYFTNYFVAAKEFELFDQCIISKRLEEKAVSHALLELARDSDTDVSRIRLVMNTYQRGFFELDADSTHKEFITKFLARMVAAAVANNQIAALAYKRIWKLLLSEIQPLIEMTIWDTLIENKKIAITQDLRKKINKAVVAFITFKFGSCEEASDFGRVKNRTIEDFYKRFNEQIRDIIRVAARFAHATVEIGRHDSLVKNATLSDKRLFDAAALYLVRQINVATELNWSDKIITFIASLARSEVNSPSTSNAEPFVQAAKEVALIMWKLEMQKRVTHNARFMGAFMGDNARDALEWINLNTGAGKDFKMLNDFVILAVKEAVEQMRLSSPSFFKIRTDAAPDLPSNANLQP